MTVWLRTSPGLIGSSRAGCAHPRVQDCTALPRGTLLLSHGFLASIHRRKGDDLSRVIGGLNVILGVGAGMAFLPLTCPAACPVRGRGLAGAGGDEPGRRGDRSG